VEHPTGESRLALGHRRVRAEIPIDIGQIPALPRDWRQAGAAATDEARALRLGDARLESHCELRIAAGDDRAD